MDHDAKPDKPDLSPFERFREFARRIIAVPKSELDKQEAEYQRQRKNRKISRARKKGITL